MSGEMDEDYNVGTTPPSSPVIKKTRVRRLAKSFFLFQKTRKRAAKNVLIDNDDQRDADDSENKLSPIVIRNGKIVKQRKRVSPSF
jgi:hypothetical protein